MFTAKAVDTALLVGMILDGNSDSYSVHDAEDALSEQLDFRTASGCYRKAFIFDNFVIKVSFNRNTSGLKDEADFIRKMRNSKKHGRHFPETMCLQVGDVWVQLQEKVDTSHRGWRGDVSEQVEDLGNFLGIDDVHSGNYGWKGKGKKAYPVFIDVDFRSVGGRRLGRPRCSWMV